MPTQQRLWLALPPTTLCCADAALTLWGQPPQYWTGELGSVVEFNPLGYVLLAYHPLAFVGGVVAIACVYLLLIAWLPQRWAFLFAFAISISHTLGGAGWLVREGPLGWLLMLAFVVAAERLVGLCCRRSQAVLF